MGYRTLLNQLVDNWAVEQNKNRQKNLIEHLTDDIQPSREWSIICHLKKVKVPRQLFTKYYGNHGENEEQKEVSSMVVAVSLSKIDKKYGQTFSKIGFIHAYYFFQ